MLEFRPCLRLSNALPLSGGRPSAADHPLQRLVGRLINQESEPRAPAIAVRVSRAPEVTTHLHFLPAQKVTPRSAVPGSPSPSSCHLSTSELHPSAKSVQRLAVKLRAAVRGRSSASTACSTASLPLNSNFTSKPSTRSLVLDAEFSTTTSSPTTTPSTLALIQHS